VSSFKKLKKKGLLLTCFKPFFSSTEFSDSFNGSFYRDALSSMVSFVEKVGKESFKKTMQNIIQDFKFDFISETEFMTRIHEK
jgi:hypothetical protein